MARRFKVYSGRGVDALEDRLFVREQLAALMADTAVACVVRECVLFCPSGLPPHVELVDTPGTGSDDPLQWQQLMGALAAASGVMVVMQRGLGANRDLQRCLRSSGLLARLVHAPARCPLVVFSALGESKAPCTAETLVADARDYLRKHEKGEPATAACTTTTSSTATTALPVVCARAVVSAAQGPKGYFLS